MGKLSKKIRKNVEQNTPKKALQWRGGTAVVPENHREEFIYVLGEEYNNKILTQDEYLRLREELIDGLGGLILGDAVMVFTEMLQNNIGKLYRDKAHRMENFGEMFRERFQEQVHTHSRDHMDLVERAGLVGWCYGD